MAGTTPKWALPYPTGTDRVADGDNAIEALARRIDTIMTVGSLVLKAGSVTLNSDGNGDFRIYYGSPFGAVLFSDITLTNDLATYGPIGFRFMPTLADNSSAVWRVYNPSNGSPLGGLLGLQLMWFAVGT